MSLFSSLKQTYEATIMERFFSKIIKCGPIPQHVAFIMDGNRRFAKKYLSGSLTTGYKMGCAVFANAVHMCLDLGISEMTVFMFSQENNNRRSTEVESILNVVLSAFLQYETEIDYINEIGISFKGLGKWETLALPEVSEAFARLVVKTKGNSRLRIIMALGYSGRDEILTNADTIIQAVENGILACDDINEKLVQDIMKIRGTSPVDLLIRTSGDTRLSNFLLWTTNDNTCLEFIKVTWPEFKFAHFLTAILKFQKYAITSLHKIQPEPTKDLHQKTNVLEFIKQTEEKDWGKIHKLSEH